MTDFKTLATRLTVAVGIASGAASCASNPERYDNAQPQGMVQQNDQPQVGQQSYDPVIPMRLQLLANDMKRVQANMASAARQKINPNDHVAMKDYLFKILGGFESLELDTKIAIRLYGQSGIQVPPTMYRIHDDALVKEDELREQIHAEALMGSSAPITSRQFQRSQPGLD